MTAPTDFGNVHELGDGAVAIVMAGPDGLEPVCDCTDQHAMHHHLIRTINRLENLMTQFSTDQAHLDADVTTLTAAIASEVDALKGQDGADKLDFTALDKLVADTQTAAAALPVPAPKNPTAEQLVGSVQTPQVNTPVTVPVTASTVPVTPLSGSTTVTPQADGTATVADPQPVTGDPVVAAGAPATVVDTSGTPIEPGADGIPTVTEPAPDVPAVTVPDAGTAAPVEATTAESEAGKHEAKPLYEHTGTDTVDPAEWPSAGVDTADGKPLFTFAGDQPGGEPTAASAEWTPYTGGTKSQSTDPGPVGP